MTKSDNTLPFQSYENGDPGKLQPKEGEKHSWFEIPKCTGI